MLRQGFDLRLGQTLSMTPQLQQAIRLLQLSSIELQEEIQQALEDNPLLQLADENSEDFQPPTAAEMAAESQSSEEHSSSIESSDMNQDIPDELSIDANWDDIYDTRSGSGNQDNNGDNSSFLENQGSIETGLQEHLLWQIRLSNLSPIDKQIAEVLIGSLDEAGYLCDSLEDLFVVLSQELPIELEDVEIVLKYIQQ